MTWLPGGADNMTAAGILVFIALLVITDKLVWHTRLRRAEERADRWEAKALELLGAVRPAVHAAEVSAELISRIPDPAAEESQR